MQPNRSRPDDGKMSSLCVSAAAKINLHLQVVGRRPDKYHELRTLFQSIDLWDELWAEPATDGCLALEVEPEGAVDVEGNLVLHAARELWQRVGSRPGARLRLVKRIPVGAGLGGGSADAAAALVLLDRMWSLGLDSAELHERAAKLGSDVPFFLVGGLALGVGRGEEVIPLPDLAEMGVLVAVPDVEIATPDVYGRLAPSLTWSAPDATVYAFAAGLLEAVPWQDFRNDLQPVVLEGWPKVAEMVCDLRRCDPVHWAVTGSGSAAFAVFRSRDEAVAAAGLLEGRWRVHAGSILTRARALPRATSVKEYAR
jgi:4-diphosphocytidyl-2-C-methyl-D-erythritol kinase